MNTEQFVKDHDIRITSQDTDSNPNMDDKYWAANHYKVTLRHNGHQFTLFYSMGMGLTGKPTASDVLDCLASEAAGLEDSATFEDWCSDYGYDTDSRKAYRTYQACQREAVGLKRLLGNELYKALLWDTDRL